MQVGATELSVPDSIQLAATNIYNDFDEENHQDCTCMIGGNERQLASTSICEFDEESHFGNDDAPVTQIIKEIQQSTAMVISPRKLPGQATLVSVKGLKNLGNTICFLNAVLQCLWAVTNHQAGIGPHIGGLLDEFLSLMSRMSSVQKENMLISPSDVKKALAHEYPQFRGRCQHDAHELLMVLLEQLLPTVNDFVGSISEFLKCLLCGDTLRR